MDLFVTGCLTMLFIFPSYLTHRRKETEKAAKDKPPAKRKAAPAKKSAKKAKMDDDAALAKKLASKRESVRDKDSKGVKSKKSAALAALRKEKQVQKEKIDESDDSELDFGDDDDDSDDDYDEEAMPWQKKGKATKSTVSRLDQADASDDDMEIDDDDEPQKKRDSRHTDRASKPIIEATLEDFKKVVIPRRRLARWCHEPFFEAAVLECFVRLFIGEDNSGEKVYRICQITDVKKGSKTYKFPVTNRNDKPVSTDKVLNLMFGKHERDFPMYLVSDEAPKEKDVRQYISVQKNHRAEVLSRRRANKLRRLQDELVNNYRYTTEDIERNLEARKKEGKKSANLGSEMTRVTIAVQGAKHSIEDAERQLTDAKRNLLEFSGDNHKELELSNSVKDAEKALLNAKAELEKRLEDERNTLAAVDQRKTRLTKRSKDINWAMVNERAVQANQKADREALTAKETEAAFKMKEFNPYARRKVRPKILWKVDQMEVEEGEKDEAVDGEEKKDSREVTAKNDKATNGLDDAPGLIPEPTEKDAGLSESHQFAIDEEVLAQSSATSQFGRGLGSRNGASKQQVRKGLSLSDYLERKANGSL
jgi:RNA polymerase-associated protein RTF1